MIKDYDGRRHADGNPHTQLPRQLAHSGPVAGGFNIAQDLPPQPLTLPGALGQLCQEHTVTQPVSFVPGHSYRLSADGSNYRHRVTVTRACVSALARWRDLFCLKQGVILDTVHRRKVVTTVECQGPNQTNRDSIEAWLKHEKPNSTGQQQEVINQTLAPARLNTACNRKTKGTLNDNSNAGIW